MNKPTYSNVYDFKINKLSRVLETYTVLTIREHIVVIIKQFSETVALLVELITAAAAQRLGQSRYRTLELHPNLTAAVHRNVRTVLCA
jgi:hypothetical protein